MSKKVKNSSNEYKWDKVQEIYVPKASPLAYTMFISERKQEIHKAQEKMTEGKPLSVKQIAQKLKSEWKHLEPEAKQKYLAVVEKENKRFDMQRKEMEDKGYFTLTDGTKSTDIPEPETELMAKRKSNTPAKIEPKVETKPEAKRPMKKK